MAHDGVWTVKIFTSRYSNGPGILESGAVPIRITAGHPRFSLPYKLAGSIPELAPLREWFDRSNFADLYVAKLEKWGPAYYVERFEELGDGHPVVLLCFENVTAGEVCHRRMFAGWWIVKTGEEIEELPDLGPAKRKPREVKAAPISDDVSRKADRLISDGKVKELDAVTYQVAGDNGLYLVTFDGERAPVRCTCEKFSKTPWILCSHRVAAWRVDQGLIATLF